MRESPKVSILIPVYNLEKNTILRCINSCIEQTFYDIEIILINDGSDLYISDYIESLKVKDLRIKHILKKENEGLPLARKSGVKESIGEFVFHLDGDDTIPKNAIELLYDKAKLQDADIVAGNFSLFRNGLLVKERKYSSFNLGSGKNFLEFILAKNLHYLCGKLIKRSLYENNIDFKKEITIGEDQIQMYQLCFYAKIVATVDDCVYNYILNDFSLTQRKKNNVDFSEQNEKFAKGLSELLIMYPYSKKVKNQLNIRILRSLYLSLNFSGHFYIKGSNELLYRTFKKTIFSSSKILIDNFPLLIRCFISIIFPSLINSIKSY